LRAASEFTAFDWPLDALIKVFCFFSSEKKSSLSCSPFDPTWAGTFFEKEKQKELF